LSFRTKKLEAGVGCQSLNKKKVQAIKIDINHEKPTDGWMDGWMDVKRRYDRFLFCFLYLTLHLLLV
jgi:hypothetical protein